jgi:hypothetical protein
MTTPLQQFKEVLEVFITTNVPQQRYDICTKCDAFTARDTKCKLSNCNMMEAVNQLEYKCPINKFQSVKIDI